MPSQPEKDVSRQRVYVIDDEPNLRASLLNFFESVQIEAVGFGSAEEFLSEADGESAGCILLDIQMPGMTGLELQAELSHRGNPMPIIFITGNGSVSVSVFSDEGWRFRLPAEAVQLSGRRRCDNKSDGGRQASKSQESGGG